jgi:hypothetical protein
MRRTGALLLVAGAALVMCAAGCWNPFAPDTKPPEGPQYFEDCDSAWKVVENLKFSYTARDITRYLDCFRDDFEFHLLEVDYDDYDGDGEEDTYWGLDLEEQFTTMMFDLVTSIELTMWGGAEYPWSGDPTGETIVVTRQFDLKVYTDGSGTQGYRATGNVDFWCKPDSTGQYYIWCWWDYSEI